MRATGESGIKVGMKTPTQGSFSITKALVIEERMPRELRPRLAVSDEGVIEIVYDPLDGEGRLKHIRSEDGSGDEQQHNGRDAKVLRQGLHDHAKEQRQRNRQGHLGNNRFGHRTRGLPLRALLSDRSGGRSSGRPG